MYNNTIISLLGIKDKHVEIVDSEEGKDCFWFELHTKVRKQKCPKCSEKTKRVHGYRWQKSAGIVVCHALIAFLRSFLLLIDTSVIR
ncbi:transposase family protein [Desertibacillus haloalkaliphilus]|uniref:transposase family protein n=1 Tax=Desertibacillus haloalkaliphilus TaxID=1328930 RepID=UPI003F68B94C